MKSFVMGIDFGSTTAKTVILDLKGRTVASCVSHMGAVSGEGVKSSVEGALNDAGIVQADNGRCVSTGYGRRMLDIADKNYTEITCTMGLVGRVGKKGPVVMTGGVAKNAAAVKHIEAALGMPLYLPSAPQIAGALGAALLALDDYRAQHKDELAMLADDELDAMMGQARACAPGCKGVPGVAGASVVQVLRAEPAAANKLQSQHLRRFVGKRGRAGGAAMPPTSARRAPLNP